MTFITHSCPWPQLLIVYYRFQIFCCHVEIQLQVEIQPVLWRKIWIRSFSGTTPLNNRVKSHLSYVTYVTYDMFDLALFRILFGLSLLFMISWHGRIWTTDHDYLWQVDEGVRPDGWTVHLMNGNGRQTMVILHRRTEVDSRTKIDRPPLGRIRTTDHDYLS